MTTYRPHLDGLRAIAILFVLFFHSGLTLLPSGFIGVDIFFVISGFLITGIIHESLQNDRFSFSEFYTRRLWRLQPVFICLLVTTALVALIYYLPYDFVQYAKSARKTSRFTSNLFFGNAAADYFSQSTNQLPLLHTWSLSIEWQCYLILPFTICLVYRLFGNRNLTRLVYLLALLFFALALYSSSNYPKETYYRFLSRFFEFLIGSCAALSYRHISFNKYFSILTGSCALLTLFYLARCSDLGRGFPDWHAFILCMATAILIITGEHYPESIVNRLLSTKPLVFTGLLSYSLYIWHWPVFALIRYLTLEETSAVLSAGFCVTFLLAYLSWRFIERPARKYNTVKFTYSLLCLFILPAAIIDVSVHFIKKNKGFPGRFPEMARVDQQLEQYASAQRPLCLQREITDVNTECRLGSKNPDSQTGFMIGDSYSNQYWRFIDTMAREVNLSILAHATTACLALPGIAQYDWYAKNAIYRECQAQTRLYYKMIKANHYDFVIIGENWKGYFGEKIINRLNDRRSPALTEQRIAAALDNALQVIAASGARPVLIRSIALTAQDPYKCFYQHLRHRTGYNPERCNFDLVTSEDQWFHDLFLRMKRKYPQLIIIDPKKVQCPKGRCKADIEGLPVFRDPGHITDYAAYQLAKVYLQNYKNPLG